MNTLDFILYNRVSEYFRARFHTKDYLVNQDCRQGNQQGLLELDGTSSTEVVNSFLNGSLNPTDNLPL